MKYTDIDMKAVAGAWAKNQMRLAKLEAELAGVHAGTHVIVPFEFIELAADPIGRDECGGSIAQYAASIGLWSDQVRDEAQPFLRTMIRAAQEGM